MYLFGFASADFHYLAGQLQTSALIRETLVGSLCPLHLRVNSQNRLGVFGRSEGVDENLSLELAGMAILSIIRD